jgi:hypothetical protein
MKIGMVALKRSTILPTIPTDLDWAPFLTPRPNWSGWALPCNLPVQPSQFLSHTLVKMEVACSAGMWSLLQDWMEPQPRKPQTEKPILLSLGLSWINFFFMAGVSPN